MEPMMGAPSPDILYKQLLEADDAGVRLEMVMGVPTWEFHPSPLHQMMSGDIKRSIQPAPGESSCGWYHVSDVYIRFPDGSIKRPDISIFCERPAPTQDALQIVPDAVVEIVSPGSEHKDVEVGPPFYLSQGVKDVVIVDPRTLVALHHRRDGLERHLSPVTLTLSCGCVLTV
jgi:Uma2 family endonuclease